MSTKPSNLWRPPIHYPSMFSEIDLSEPSIFESSQLHEWKQAFDLLVERLGPYFNIPDIVFVVDSNMIWVISEIEIPDNGDIKRDNGIQSAACNKISIIKQVCKLYKPSLWNNMGFGFVTPKQYKVIHNSTPVKSSNVTPTKQFKSKLNSGIKKSGASTSKKQRKTLNSILTRDGYESDPENSNTNKRKKYYQEDSSSEDEEDEEKDEVFIRPRKKGKFIEAIELTKNPMSESAIRDLPKPPPSIWRRGKRNNEEKVKIEEWEDEIKGLGYSPVDYKKYVYLKRKESEKLKNADKVFSEQFAQLTNLAMNANGNEMGPNNIEEPQTEETERSPKIIEEITPMNEKEESNRNQHEDDLENVTNLLYAMSKNN